MASISKEKRTADGRRYYIITVSRGRGISPFRTRWYRPDGWADSSVKRRLENVAAEFEQECRNGNVLSRAEQKAKAEEEKAKAAAEAAAAKTEIMQITISCRKRN